MLNQQILREQQCEQREQDRQWQEKQVERDRQWRREDQQSERLKLWSIALWTLFATSVTWIISLLSLHD